MGGFSASYLVRSSDAEAVAGELKRLMADEGWQPSTTPLADEDTWGVGGLRRGIIVCQPCGGWVAVIDSAAMVSDSPAALSRALDTSAFNFHVHDSDFWTYAFFRSGLTIDQFTSMDESEYFGSVLGEIDDEADGYPHEPTVSLKDRWKLLKDCLRGETTRAELEDVLKPVDLSSLENFSLVTGEAGLAAFLSLLGCDSSLAQLSYRYWLEDPAAQTLTQHCHLLYEHPDASGDQHHAMDDNEPTVDLRGAALHSAAASNDIETIEQLIANGVDINGIPRGFTVTALAMAASYASPATIRTLVSLGADLQQTGRDGASPLRLAVQSGNAENVVALIEIGADPHEFDPINGSLLHQAVIVQSAAVVSSLLRHGVDASLKNGEGLTPLEHVRIRRTAIEQALSKMSGHDTGMLHETDVLRDCLDAFVDIERRLDSH
ncbi:ankyrin repeat domain-containing protein [Allorhodopirellula heiligendammensis]|uniref:Ankyrin repeats (3 copies) n=1 Tax=Allorhodopirellula heiligendammensis TaxID=2714739 RepID=A0A5C6C5V9_9BACT|nr:ankyrin repeat domain-containing protein [Allorhodopirellula heiligendammensis]TWU19515.1 Ankyrin repeats (3 copies) [Allorhodopirellula heiligendammensis]